MNKTVYSFIHSGIEALYIYSWQCLESYKFKYNLGLPMLLSLVYLLKVNTDSALFTDEFKIDFEKSANEE